MFLGHFVFGKGEGAFESLCFSDVLWLWILGSVIDGYGVVMSAKLFWRLPGLKTVTAVLCGWLGETYGGQNWPSPFLL